MSKDILVLNIFHGKGAGVFVLESGIDAGHSDLSPNQNTELCTFFVPGEYYNVDDGFFGISGYFQIQG